MSTYTPCFPPSDPRRLASSSTSISGDHAPKVSFNARLSRAHLALASVSDYVRRPPSPTSAAIDVDRVVRLRRKFRHAVAAAYRDTSSGKWAHVSELARLGCTIGSWQGVCSGSKAPHTLRPPSAGDRNEKGESFERERFAMRTYLQAGVADGPQPEINPYPRPPVPIFDLGEIRERVENWKATVVSAPLSQADSQDPHPQHGAENAELLSPLNFPIVKRRKSDVAKAMKRKRKASSDRGYTTSRYFRGDGLADRMSPQAQAMNRDAECVTPAPRSVAPRSNAELTPHSRAESQDHDPETVHKLSPMPAPITAPENIHQIAEAFLPPSFPSQLQTSTPPPACDRLIKPPAIPHAEGLFLSASLHSPPPFPRSQLPEASQPLRTPARSRQDIPSPAGSPNPKSKRRLQSTSAPSPSSSDSEPPHARRRRDRDLDLNGHIPSAPAAPVIDLHLLASQRSRDSLSRRPSRVFALGSSPMTPLTASKDKGKGKARAMSADLVSTKQSRALSSSPSPPRLHAPQTQTPPLSPPPDFTRDAHAFAPAATSTQQPHARSQFEIFGREALGSRGSGVFGRGRDVDGVVPWARDVPVVEADGDVEVDVDVGANVGMDVG